jgi:hypothetical protein
VFQENIIALLLGSNTVTSMGFGSDGQDVSKSEALSESFETLQCWDRCTVA